MLVRLCPGGVTESGVVATILLVHCGGICSRDSAGERHQPGKMLLAGYLAQAVTCAVVASRCSVARIR